MSNAAIAVMVTIVLLVGGIAAVNAVSEDVDHGMADDFDEIVAPVLTSVAWVPLAAIGAVLLAAAAIIAGGGRG